MHVRMFLLYNLFQNCHTWLTIFLNDSRFGNLQEYSQFHMIIYLDHNGKLKLLKCFVNFHLVLLFCATIMKFWKWLLKIAFCFLLSLSWWDSKKKNMESYTGEKVRYSCPKNIKFHFCSSFKLINPISSTISL